MKRFLNALNRGPTCAMRVLVDRVWDRVQERRLGIRSAGLVPIETLIESWRDCHDYAPTSILAFAKIMRAIEVVEDRDVFVDFGCGMGRVLVLASAFAFRKIIGVEISPTLSDVALRNVGSYRGIRRCQEIEIRCQGADTFSIPPDATVFYFANPFHGNILASVMSGIERSMKKRPRKITVVFYNPRHFLTIAARYPFLVPRHQFSLEHECIIYQGDISRLELASHALSKNEKCCEQSADKSRSQSS
jgi:SAM-dependent methyltransferase